MSALVEAVSDAVSDVVDTVGSVASDVVDTASSVVESVVAPVAQAVTTTVESAINNPVQTALTVAAIASGQPELVPMINAGQSLANGASLDQVIQSAAISTAGMYAGAGVAGETAGALGDYGSKVAGSAVAGATSAALSGGDPFQGAVSGTITGSAAYGLAPGTTGATADNGQPPGGMQLASADSDTASDAGNGFHVDVSGAPIFAESQNASAVKAPFGYDLMSASLADTKPEGAYYDITQNAWFAPNQAVQELQSAMESGDFSGAGGGVGTGGTGVGVAPLNYSAMGAYISAINAGATQDEAMAIANRVSAGGESGFGTGTSAGTGTGATSGVAEAPYGGTMPEVTVTAEPDTAPVAPVVPPVTNITTTPEATPEDPSKTRISVPTIAPTSGTLGGFSAPSIGGSGTDASSKISSPSETWLGGMFRNTQTPGLAMLASLGLLPDQQQAQALSSLQQASGIGPAIPSFFSYGQAVDPTNILGGSIPTQNYAEGGKIMASPLMAASGGDVEHKGSHYVQGAGGGQDDLIPAKLADGEYVFDAEIVAALGDGSNKEGAKKLDAMREAIREHKRSGSTKTIPPKAKSPLQYFKEANK